VAGEQDAIGLLMEIDFAARLEIGGDAYRPNVGSDVRIRLAGHRLFAVDLGLPVHEIEQISESADGLRRSQEEIALLVESVVKRGNDSFLQVGRHVDENVAAAHQIDVRERRIGRDVLAREYTDVPDALLDPVN